MKFDMNWEIVTNDKEIAVSNKDNTYALILEGYHLYPIDKEIVVYKNKNSKAIGKGVVRALTLKFDQTMINYELTSLHTVN